MLGKIQDCLFEQQRKVEGAGTRSHRGAKGVAGSPLARPTVVDHGTKIETQNEDLEETKDLRGRGRTKKLAARILSVLELRRRENENERFGG